MFLMGLAIFLAGCGGSSTDKPVKVGLIAPFSGPLSASGEAIQRGMLLAIDEINQDGGVQGRPLELVTRDIQNDPEAGVTALREMVEQEQIVAVFGSIFSPVMLGQLDAIHELEIPLINPWGSVTEITKNGRQPNYAFRVSVSDEQADEFLVRYALEVKNVQQPGIIADTSTWGDSNVAGLVNSLAARGMTPAGVERFDQGDTNMSGQLERLQQAGADGLLMIANAPEGAGIVRSMATLGWDAPVVSHWGVSGGNFVELAGADNAEKTVTLQTYSFYGPQSPRGEALQNAYHARFGTHRTEEIMAPVGVAHGYDGMQLLAQAIRQAGSTDGPKMREALENLEPFDGLVKRYAPPFTPDNHDALLAADYMMTVWQDGKLVPAPQPQLTNR
jgi:branched-chain amino acid transport system substrate-binding protein